MNFEYCYIMTIGFVAGFALVLLIGMFPLMVQLAECQNELEIMGRNTVRLTDCWERIQAYESQQLVEEQQSVEKGNMPFEQQEVTANCISNCLQTEYSGSGFFKHCKEECQAQPPVRECAEWECGITSRVNSEYCNDPLFVSKYGDGECLCWSDDPCAVQSSKVGESE